MSLNHDVLMHAPLVKHNQQRMPFHSKLALKQYDNQLFLNSDGTNPVFLPGPDGLPPYTELPPTPVGASTDIKDDLKTVNFGGTFAIGLSKNLNANSELFFDARASYGFNTIQINDQYGESSIGGVIFSLGYACKI